MPTDRASAGIGYWAMLLMAGFVLLLVTRVYYAFVFLPAHHGSCSDVAVRLIDFGGWIAYVRSPMGMLLHGLTLGCLLAAFLLLGFKKRRFEK